MFMSAAYIFPGEFFQIHMLLLGILPLTFGSIIKIIGPNFENQRAPRVLPIEVVECPH